MHGLGARGVGLHEVVEALGELVAGAAVDEFLLDAVELREFAEDGLAAEFAEEVGDVAEGGISGDAAEAVGTSALESDGECREWSGCTCGAIGFNECQQRFVRERRS